MICENCLVNPICKVGCNKLRKVTVKELDSNEKMTQRLLSINLDIVLKDGDIRVQKINPDILEWYKNGLLHREDGPAVIYSTGLKVWYEKGNFLKKDK